MIPNESLFQPASAQRLEAPQLDRKHVLQRLRDDGVLTLADLADRHLPLRRLTEVFEWELGERASISIFAAWSEMPLQVLDDRQGGLRLITLHRVWQFHPETRDLLEYLLMVDRRPHLVGQLTAEFEESLGADAVRQLVRKLVQEGLLAIVEEH